MRCVHVFIQRRPPPLLRLFAAVVGAQAQEHAAVVTGLLMRGSLRRPRSLKWCTRQQRECRLYTRSRLCGSLSARTEGWERGHACSTLPAVCACAHVACINDARHARACVVWDRLRCRRPLDEAVSSRHGPCMLVVVASVRVTQPNLCQSRLGTVVFYARNLKTCPIVHQRGALAVVVAWQSHAMSARCMRAAAVARAVARAQAHSHAACAALMRKFGRSTSWRVGLTR